MPQYWLKVAPKSWSFIKKTIYLVSTYSLLGMLMSCGGAFKGSVCFWVMGLFHCPMSQKNTRIMDTPQIKDYVAFFVGLII
jgi:hypothetical protein